MSDEVSARDELEAVIVDYAIDYDRQEYARTTRFSEVSTALAKFEAAIRRDQIESLIERIPRVDGVPVLGWMPVENWLRAQIGDINEQ